MNRQAVVRAVIWTIIYVGLFFFVAAATLLGDCAPFDGACIAGVERNRKVLLVGSPLIWLIGLLLIFRGRRA